MAMLPMAMYGLEVPCGDVAIPASMADIRSAFRITMAAIDPTAEPEGEEGQRPIAVLKVIRQALDVDDADESDDDFDQEEMERILREEASDESDEDEDDEDGMNGGPSDPAKSKAAKRAAAEKKIKELLEAEGMDIDDEEEEEDGKPNGINGISKKAKGKQPASDDDEDDENDEDDDDELDVEEFVICTLDPQKVYQQTLDITFGEDERVFFKVSGTHSIFLTGNYVSPADESVYDPDSDEDDEYDLEPDMDELDDEDMDEMDELDDMADPRITEVDDEDEAPALVKATTNGTKANKNKRSAPDSADEDDADAGAAGLDEMIANDLKAVQAAANGEHNKLTKKEKKELKKQEAKKLKTNDGTAAAAPGATKVEQKKEAEAPSSNKSDKKVSFAKELEQGPTPTKVPEKAADGAKGGPSLGVKTVQGVTIDDRKLGTGQAAKNGDRVSMRYIGKLKDNNKVFDNNKKGKPFSFKLGSGEVIKGWDIGVAGMQVGGERRITVPPHLGYGKQRTGEIPPNSTLVFDLKVLSIDRK